jgi:tetratricopeptide (TPR) repeat protein
MIWRSFFTVLIVVAAFGAAQADDTATTTPKYHAGSRVIVIHETPLRVDDHPVKQLDPGTPLVVEEVKDGFLGVTSGREGWVDETDVVPLEKSLGPLADLLAHDADNAELHLTRAEVADELKEWDTVVADYTALIRLQPDELKYLRYRGAALAEKKEWDKALDDFNQSIKREESPVAGLMMRGWMWSEKEDYDKALADFDEAMKHDPDAETKAEILRYRATVNLDRKEYDKAIADMTEALKLNPASSTLYLTRAHINTEAGKLEKAIADYSSALWITPGDSTIYSARGEAFRRNNEMRAALSDLKAAVEYAPENATAQNNLAWLLATCPDEKIRNGKSAIEHAQKADELTEHKESWIIDTLAATYAETGDFDKAVECQQNAIKLAGQDEKLLKDLREHLELYQQKKPFRDLPDPKPAGN